MQARASTISPAEFRRVTSNVFVTYVAFLRAEGKINSGTFFKLTEKR